MKEVTHINLSTVPYYLREGNNSSLPEVNGQTTPAWTVIPEVRGVAVDTVELATWSYRNGVVVVIVLDPAVPPRLAMVLTTTYSRLVPFPTWRVAPAITPPDPEATVRALTPCCCEPVRVVLVPAGNAPAAV
jgi:hypothetical protein